MDGKKCVIAGLGGGWHCFGSWSGLLRRVLCLGHVVQKIIWCGMTAYLTSFILTDWGRQINCSKFQIRSCEVYWDRTCRSLFVVGGRRSVSQPERSRSRSRLELQRELDAKPEISDHVHHLLVSFRAEN